MSTLKIKITSGKTEFAVAPSDAGLWTKASYTRSGPKIGTVLIEDLARAGKADLYPLLETFESSEVPCQVSVFGDFYCGDTEYDLPAYFLLNEDGNIEMRGPIEFSGKK